MPRAGVVIGALLAAMTVFVAAGCGSDKEKGSSATTDVPALELTGNATTGAAKWKKAGCGACHTMSAAGATATVGPDLDETKPTYELLVTQVTIGKRTMPSFESVLTPQEIADIAAYVVKSTKGA
jgi:mono/diheme cytochrome c family protein